MRSKQFFNISIVLVGMILGSCNPNEKSGQMEIDYKAQAALDDSLLKEQPITPEDPWANYYSDFIQLDNGLKYQITSAGSGAVIQEGDLVEMEFVAKHSHQIIFKESTVFDFGFRDVMDEGSFFKGYEKALIGRKEGAEISVYIPHYLVDNKSIGSPYGKSVTLHIKVKKIMPFHEQWSVKGKVKKSLREGVYYHVIGKSGKHQKAKKGDEVYVRYAVYDAADGTLIESNFNALYLRETKIGKFGVIDGWNLALPYFNVGDSVQLYVPSSMAYRTVGKPGIIPPNTNLVFDLIIEKIKP